jgi:rhomboid protease GluP
LYDGDTTLQEKPKQQHRSTAVYVLMLINLIVFVLDKVMKNPIISRQFYLFHRRWKWWQPLTTCFCHVDRFHLSSNLFLLLLFGRSVEDDQGWVGLLFSFAWCGVLASLVSLWLLPSYTVSIGASGAVFGLFTVSMLAKLSWKDLDWRKIVEVAVLGEFVFRQITSEIANVAGGGRSGINHIAHLSGAIAGAVLVFGMRATIASYDQKGKTAAQIKLKKREEQEKDPQKDKK